MVFPKIKGGRTDKITHIFYKEQIKLRPTLLFFQEVESLMDLGRIQMTGTACGQLDYRYSFGPNTLRVPIGLNVSFNHSDPKSIPKSFNGLFQKGRLAGTGTGNHINGHCSHSFNMNPVLLRHGRIGSKEALVHFNHL